jgi:endonuclease YncB( thermonuclease family)
MLLCRTKAVVLSITVGALSFALLSASAFACDLPPGQKGTVAEVKDGETLALTDGTLVRLINAKAPAAHLAARGDRPWPFVAEPSRL